MSNSTRSALPETESPFNLSNESTSSSSSQAKTKHRVRIDESISHDTIHSQLAMLNESNLRNAEARKNNDDGSVSPSTRSSGSPPPMRRRTISQKSEDHFLLIPSGQKVYTKGRPPWYNDAGKLLKEPYVIGICGGSASGKTTVARRIIERLEIPWVTVLSMDSFYKVLTPEQREQALQSNYNFDHPDAFDFDLLEETLRRLRMGKSVEVPVYDFSTHSRDRNSKLMYGADVIIFEGILSLFRPEIVEMMDLKASIKLIFVETDSDTRLARRVTRDTVERGRDLNGILEQYFKFVKPAYESFIAPAAKVADLIVPRGGSNTVAIELIVRQVKNQLETRGYDATRSSCRNSIQSCEIPIDIPESLCVIDQTPQVIGLHTILRNRDITRDEFVFVAERLMQILMEKSLEFVSFTDIEVETPNGEKYLGCRRSGDICGVAIMRAGETLERPLRGVVKDCKIGKILIQNNAISGVPELHFLRLPKSIEDYNVMLLDAVVTTGAAAIMAIRILLDHDVKEENITLLSLMMTQMGVHSIAYAFPKVNLVTTAVDKHINAFGEIIPGLGNFGDRFYGTEAVINSSSEEEDEIEDDVLEQNSEMHSRTSSLDSAINSSDMNEVRELNDVVAA